MVDANVVRVLARLRRLAGDPKLAVKEHAALADVLLDPDRPGDFNQVASLPPGSSASSQKARFDLLSGLDLHQ